MSTKSKKVSTLAKEAGIPTKAQKNLVLVDEPAVTPKPDKAAKDEAIRERLRAEKDRIKASREAEQRETKEAREKARGEKRAERDRIRATKLTAKQAKIEEAEARKDAKATEKAEKQAAKATRDSVKTGEKIACLKKAIATAKWTIEWTTAKADAAAVRLATLESKLKALSAE